VDRLDKQGAAMTSTAYDGYGVPTGAHGWYPMGRSESESLTDRLTRSLWLVVTVLGVATFGVSFASPVALGFPVRLSVFAAIVAAVGLLRGQPRRGWIVVALTLTGFLDTADGWVRSHDIGWALTVIMVLNALQSLAAVGALLQETRMLRSADSGGARDYLAYAQFATAYQAYAAQYQPAAEPQAAAQETAQAHGEGVASARTATVSAEQESLSAMQARYAQHGVGPAQRTSGSPGGAPVRPTADPGMPGVDRSVPDPHPYRPQQDSRGQASSI
jgi:hypothetical protein